MKVLNLCYDDYANYMHDNALALRSVGVECESLKIVQHPFGYDEQAYVATHDEMIEAIADADLVQFVHSDIGFARHFMTYLKNKKCVVYHTGSRYRATPEEYNRFFNTFVDATFTDQCEFMSLGAKNLHYAAVAINTEAYKNYRFRQEVGNPYIIAHYPSNPEVKGSEQINEMMSRVILPFDNTMFLSDPSKFSHAMNMKRVSACDIYIELFKPVLNGKPYGCYGVSAFEAAACGKVVVTQNLNKDVYLHAYGSMPFLIANTEADFIQIVSGLIRMEPIQISRLQTETYNWLQEKHSYKASGNYIANILHKL